MQRHRYNWTLPRVTLQLGDRTALMGILNVTPDSFSDGGRYFTPEQAVARGREMEQEGADIIDIGGESTRPGGTAVSEAEESRRVLPVVESLVRTLRVPISIDTYRSAVAKRAIEAGAQIVNDISGFRFDSEMAEVVRSCSAAVVLMHSRGARNELHSQAPMLDALEQVKDDLEAAAGRAITAGISRASIAIDPGIGFGKQKEESLKVLRRLDRLAQLQYPLLIGTSRKSFIRSIINEPPEGGAGRLGTLWGTAATIAVAVERGAHIVRVHDVREMRVFSDVVDAIARYE